MEGETPPVISLNAPIRLVTPVSYTHLRAHETCGYVMTTKNGQTIVTQGKPQLDKETGMTSYTDQEGNQREINSNDVAQLIKAD